MADQLTKTHFENKEGSVFKAKAGSASLDLKLVECRSHDQEHTEGFTLLFEGPEDQEMPQGTFALHHDEVGEHEVFLTPVQADPHSTEVIHYEAVFNRVKEKGE